MAAPVEYLGEIPAFVNTRPRRLAYLVRQTDFGQLQDAIAYATSEWGGYSQPILPVARRRRIFPRWWQFAEVLRPEVFIDYVGVDERLKEAVAAKFGAPVIPPPIAGVNEPGVHATVVHARDSLRSRTLLVPSSRATLAEKMALGIIPQDIRAPWEALGASIEPLMSPAELVRAQIGEIPSPLWLTRSHTGIYQSEDFLGGPIILFSDRMTPWRLLTFWNVRAAASGNFGPYFVLFVPMRNLGDPDVGAVLRELSLRQMSRPDIVFIGRDEARLRAIADSHGFIEGEGGTSISLASPDRPRDLSEKPLTYRVNLDPRTWVMGHRMDGIRTPVNVNMTRPSLRVRADRNVPLQGFGGLIRTDIQGLEALDWPASAGVARLVSDGAEYTQHGLSFVEAPDARIDKVLSVPSPDAVLTAFLEDRGWSWAVSDKGRYVQGLIGSLRDAHGLTSLQSRLAIRAVQALASLRRQKIERTLSTSGTSLKAGELEALMRDLVSTGQQRWRTAAETASDLGVPREQVIAVFAALVGDNLVQRGLGYKCPRCTMSYPIPLDRVQDHMRCEGCSFVSPVLGVEGDEPEFRYALNSLLDRVIEQDCLGHLLAMWLMERNHETLWMIPGAIVRTGDPPEEREVDLLGLSRKQVIVGELKARSSAFTRAETEDKVNLAHRLGAKLLVLGGMDDWAGDGKARTASAVDSSEMELLVVGLSDLAQEP